MELVKSSEIDYGSCLKILSYGKTGTGKTYFCGSATRLGKTLVVSCESGLLTIKDREFDTLPVKTWSDFNEAWNIVSKVKGEYKTIILDSITEVQRLLMDHIAPGKALELQQWGEVELKMHKVIRSYRNLDNNVIITALAKESKDDVLGSTSVMPMVKGSLAQNIGAYFDCVFYHFAHVTEDRETGNKVTQYKMLTQNDNRFIAKNRAGKLNRVEPNDFEEIHNKIFEPITEEVQEPLTN